MYYFVELNSKPEVRRSQIVEAYEKFARRFETKLPQFKLIGLYVRNVLLGSRPHYLAIWEFPSFSDLDEWGKTFAKDQEGQKHAKEFVGLTTDWEVKVMSKLI